ncbi:MAG: type transport system permease protein [Frankiales bacterium]|jgi:ABC-2 type transport system permease protein|nr:type transport system permease protein [Frankiales bacterium]
MSSADLALRPAAAMPPVAYRGTLARQVRSELRLVFGRRRNIAMLLVLSAIPILIGVALKASGQPRGGGPAFFSLVTGNGLFLAFAALTVCLPVFLPLAVAVVGGDAVAGEASAGTLRYLLTVPISRPRLLAVKAAGVLAYLAGAVGVVAVTGGVIGAVLFGLHDVVLLSGDTVPALDGAVRTLGVCAFVFVDLLGLAAIALFFSTVTEVPVGAMAGTVATAIAFAVLDSVPQLSSIHPILLTHHWLDFSELLRGQVHIWTLLHSTFVPLAYTAIFGSLAWAKITSADITS